MTAIKILGRQLPDWGEGFIHWSRRQHCPLCCRPMGVPPCLNQESTLGNINFQNLIFVRRSTMSPINGDSALFKLAMFVVPCYLLEYTYINYTHRSLIIRRISGNILTLLTFDMTGRCPMNETSKGPVPFTQLVKVRRGKLVLALTSIRFSWNFYQIISGTKYE